MKVNVALAICVNRKALNTHIWKKVDCVVAKLICDVERISLCREVCICHACYKQVSRNVNNPIFQPRWKPKQAIPKAICSVNMYGKGVYGNTNMASREQIEKSVGLGDK